MSVVTHKLYIAQSHLCRPLLSSVSKANKDKGKRKGKHEIERSLNIDFANICKKFLMNKLNICYGEEKVKSVLVQRLS